MVGVLETPAGPVPVVGTTLRRRDHFGSARVRLGFRRMHYSVAPGLYAVGNPDRQSPVLVTANYKLSFDHLRRACDGLSAWVLVLDTGGVNVWCAAGKGSFGTDELAHRIAESGVDMVVDHRRLILPQLGAPGVAAHLVERRTGFEVTWGPVMAADLPAFLAAGMSATLEMRRKRFGLVDRAVVVPVELCSAAGPLMLVALAVVVVGGFAGSGGFQAGALAEAARGGLVLLIAALTGLVGVPLLLPWLPGTAFSVKGAVLGGIMTALALSWRAGWDPGWVLRPGDLAWLVMGTALAAFLAMDFTGSSTFTSLSGVRREVRIAVPLEIAAVVVGLALWLSSLWLPGAGG